MLPATTILRLHDEATQIWHQSHDAPFPDEPTLHTLILRQHRANFDLWHQEDAARSPHASDALIASVKHTIDRLNQQRNDLVEQIDLALLAEAPTQNPTAPLHSETPGLIVDRLSILELKIHHTADESCRASASAEHRARNLDRLQILNLQRADLAACLDQLWADILAGRRRFQLYRQMKMYNDPELNPAVYGRFP